MVIRCKVLIFIIVFHLYGINDLWQNNVDVQFSLQWLKNDYVIWYDHKQTLPPPIDLPTYLPTHSPPTYLPAYILTHPPTRLLTYSPTYLCCIHPLTHLFITYLPTNPLTYLPTYLFTHPPTYLLTHPHTYTHLPIYLLPTCLHACLPIHPPSYLLLPISYNLPTILQLTYYLFHNLVMIWNKHVR